MEKLFDLYTDYLQVTFPAATPTGLSAMVDGTVGHGQVTRMLSQPERGSKDLLLNVKPLVRQQETDDACLIFEIQLSRNLTPMRMI